MRQLRLENLFIAFATFGLGVAFSSLFSSVSVLESVDPQSIGTENPDVYTSKKSDACVEFVVFDTEEAFSIQDKIHETKLVLRNLEKRTTVNKPEVERRTQDRENRLEAKLQILLSDWNTYVQSEFIRQRDALRRSGREICNEN